MFQPVLYTSFLNTSSVILNDEAELSERAACEAIGSSTVLGYATTSLRVTSRDGSHRRLVATLSGGRVAAVFDFVDTFCGSTPPDFA